MSRKDTKKMSNQIVIVYKSPNGELSEKTVNAPVTKRDIISLFELDSTATVFANGKIMGDADTLTLPENLVSSVVQAKGR